MTSLQSINFRISSCNCSSSQDEAVLFCVAPPWGGCGFFVRILSSSAAASRLTAARSANKSKIFPRYKICIIYFPLAVFQLTAGCSESLRAEYTIDTLKRVTMAGREPADANFLGVGWNILLRQESLGKMGEHPVVKSANVRLFIETWYIDLGIFGVNYRFRPVWNLECTKQFPTPRYINANNTPPSGQQIWPRDWSCLC